MHRRFIVFGEDARMASVADFLEEKGLEPVSFSALPEADLLLFGLPTASFEPWESDLGQAKPGALIFAGKVSRQAKLQAARHDLPVIDYMESDELALLNAIPTAEGALGILLSATRGTLWHSRAVVTGYGRVAQVLVPRLQALGCRVTVAARSASARALAAALGCCAVDFKGLPRAAEAAEFLINTVPQTVVTAEVLAALPKNAYVMDLASAPGGVDTEAAKNLGVRAEAALGLPGKWAPRAAGEYIGRAVWGFLESKGEFEQ